MGEVNSIQGIFLDSIFFNEENGFSIGTVLVTEHQCPEEQLKLCLLYTSDAADDLLCVDLGGRRIIKKKKR